MEKMRQPGYALRAVLVLLFISLSVTLGSSSAARERLKGKGQVTYAESNATSASSESKEFESHSGPVWKSKAPALPYPGDVSFFYRNAPKQFRGSGPSSEADAKGPSQSRARARRGAYLRDSREEEEAELRPNSMRLESRMMAVYEAGSAPVQHEMSFDGAGYLRPSADDVNLPRISNKFLPPPENRRAAEHFQAAFHPEHGRGFSHTRFDDDQENQPRGPEQTSKTAHSGEKEPIEAKGVDFSQTATPSHAALPQDTATVFTMFPQQFPNALGMNSFFYNNNPYPQPSPAQAQEPKYADGDRESLLKNHRLEPAASEVRKIVISKAGIMANSTVSRTKKSASPFSGKQDIHRSKSRRKRSVSSKSLSSDPNSGGNGNEVPDESSVETRSRAHYSISDDQEDSGTGFIPLTGTFNGGTIHLTLPYYGSTGPASSPYSSGPPVNYDSYSRGGRHYPGHESYYPHSEARRYSYGMLGSGNFEVIRGGVFGENEPNVIGGYDGGRTPYSPEVYNNYGTTEIIIDGPSIQGFQGFDNFPVHLLNALSKRSEIVVRKPHIL